MKIVFFDGHCGLCSTLVNWLILRDRSHEIKFAPLGGSTASKLLDSKPGVADDNSVIYLRDGRKLKKSEAILNILYDTGGVWRSAKVFLLVPRPVRDFFYRVVAKNRHRIFSKQNVCLTPSPALRHRLLP